LSQQQDVRDSLADIYIKTEIQRLFGLRNFYLTYARKPKSYEGPQLSYIARHRALDDRRHSEAVGRRRAHHRSTWGSPSGVPRDPAAQRHSSRSIRRHDEHPARADRLRRIGIGRSTREKAGTVHGAE